MRDVLIEAANITVVRQGRQILKDVSVCVGERDFMTIIGPNGAGKSMLLKCLMGFYQPDKGEVAHRQGLRVGYVPQRLVPGQTMPMTVKRFLRLRKKVDESEVQQVSQETGTEKILNKNLSALSSGELQLVLLARSLLDNPELLILDEPAQNLDISGQLAFYKWLERVYARRGLSILMVSHDLHMVMASTRHVVCLSTSHRVCCSGEPKAVTNDPAFVSLFGDDMSRMMAVYQHSLNHIRSGGDHA